MVTSNAVVLLPLSLPLHACTDTQTYIHILIWQNGKDGVNSFHPLQREVSRLTFEQLQILAVICQLALLEVGTTHVNSSHWAVDG